MGRTARGEGGVGNALLILQPDELGFIRYLKQAKVPVSEFEFSWSKVANIQSQVRVRDYGSTLNGPQSAVALLS